MASFLVNGWPAQSIDTADRGLAYGDGVFRTLLVREGRVLNWARHYRLLERRSRSRRLGRLSSWRKSAASRPRAPRSRSW